ncbi:RtcB family protein [Terrimonas sp. NA20]|uniref:3'-phosphate/5'-hydroxy nucleic acid ligase n=1 Tax=Terrimonas ginsenosidimutans TaxID=2908004 RepID=A0ABS9KKU3_9BACT|nr:RtcB family protein [Terrimonas ginsenosidimutans]MCG2612932.1 RtcB family protein [Terrimonas ginsenosidimutans]
MKSIAFYCNASDIENNALEQLQQYAGKPFVNKINAFTDIHFCQEKSLPVGVAFETGEHAYLSITGKDIGCGVMFLKLNKACWTRTFDKPKHYTALNFAHQKMTDEGLGGGNHFLSIEEDDNDVYIICHTGTRNRGIALYQSGVELSRQFAAQTGEDAGYVHRSFISSAFLDEYEKVLRSGYERRKNFVVKTMIFLQQAGYIKSGKKDIPKDYLKNDFSTIAETGELYGTPYSMQDSIHNHLRFEKDRIVHRKGSTELLPGRTVVIPLSMSRGSLLVTAAASASLSEALYSCAHGAGRKLSRYDAMKYWKTVLKEKQRREYRQRFEELLDRSGNFPGGYIQEFDFAYKDSECIFTHQPYLKKLTQTRPVVTIKYTEI